MSDYTKTVDFAAKDALATGDPNKIASGTEVGTEFDNIATAVATKSNKVASPTADDLLKQSATGDLTDVPSLTHSGTEVTVPSGHTLNVQGTSSLKLGGAAVTSTAAELNKLDGLSGDVVGTSDVQTLTNKSIAASQIDSGTLPLARITDGTLADAKLINPAVDQYLSHLDETTVAEADFPTVFSDNSGYSIFKVRSILRPSVDDRELQLLVTDDSGSTYETVSSYSSYGVDRGGTGFSRAGQAILDLMPSLGTNAAVRSATTSHAVLDLTISYPNNSAYHTLFQWSITWTNGSGANAHGVFAVASALTGFKLLFESGNIADHTTTVSGIKMS